MEIREIDRKTAVDFILPKHYSGRVPSISVSYGWFHDDGRLCCAITFGKPASPYLCIGICGRQYSKFVYELNRVCSDGTNTEPISKFISWCIRDIKKKHDWIIVSYSDTAMQHHGYIYQACNFIYTGVTKQRTDIYSGDKKHPRHYTDEDKTCGIRKVRSAKHRYIYWCTRNKALKKEWQENLLYKQMPYPKGDNAPDYELGHFLKEQLISTDQGVTQP